MAQSMLFVAILMLIPPTTSQSTFMDSSNCSRTINDTIITSCEECVRTFEYVEENPDPDIYDGIRTYNYYKGCFWDFDGETCLTLNESSKVCSLGKRENETQKITKDGKLNPHYCERESMTTSGHTREYFYEQANKICFGVGYQKQIKAIKNEIKRQEEEDAAAARKPWIIAGIVTGSIVGCGCLVAFYIWWAKENSEKARREWEWKSKTMDNRYTEMQAKKQCSGCAGTGYSVILPGQQQGVICKECDGSGEV
eukprot:234660_1